MRVTEHRMIELAARGVSRAREDVARAGEALQSGQRVTVPSDDPAAWAAGARVRSREIMSEARGEAIALTRERLAATDGALGHISSLLQRATELTVQGANGSLVAEDRAAIAVEIRTLREAALAAANTRGPDDEYLLAGTTGGAAFDPTGTYLGNGTIRQVDSGEAARQGGSVPGTWLTATAGVDVLSLLDQIAAAFEANDPATASALLDPLHGAVTQVAVARTTAGSLMSELDAADAARQDLELTLAEERARALDIDPVKAASDFARAASTLEAARVAADEIVSLATGRR